MRKVINVFSNLKWIGLFGIPLLFSDFYLWKLFWMFWLFGIVEIVITFPVLIQSFRQIIGVIISQINNNPMPDKDNFISQIKYSLPFNNQWVVVNGGVDKVTSHSWNINSQRYAYDFIILDEDGKSFSDTPDNLANYYCYEKEILAPADGIVVKVRTDCKNSKIMENGKTDPLIKDIRGNYIIIKHAPNEYSCLAHLMPNSISVCVGDVVKSKQVIALCGNTGNTSEPHLHFQIQNTSDFYNSAGLPIHFEQIKTSIHKNYNKYDQRPILVDKAKDDIFISRGHLVKNK